MISNKQSNSSTSITKTSRNISRYSRNQINSNLTNLSSMLKIVNSLVEEDNLQILIGSKKRISQRQKVKLTKRSSIDWLDSRNIMVLDRAEMIRLIRLMRLELIGIKIKIRINRRQLDWLNHILVKVIILLSNSIRNCQMKLSNRNKKMTRSECSGVKSKVGCWNSLNKSGRKRR